MVDPDQLVETMPVKQDFCWQCCCHQVAFGGTDLFRHQRDLSNVISRAAFAIEAHRERALNGVSSC